MKMTYICSPCRGDYEKNITKAQEYCREALLEGLLPIAPHVYFTQFIDDTHPKERKRGLLCGLQLLRRCQLIRVYGCRVSSGMFDEIQLAGVLGIEIEVYGPPEFVECVMEIYHNATVTQRIPLNIPAAASAAAEAAAPAAMPALKKPAMRADTGPAFLSLNLTEQQSNELARKVEEEMRSGNLLSGLMRGGADY